MILYHGSHNQLMGTNIAHEGMCFTSDIDTAMIYGSDVYTLDASNLVMIDVDGYDRNENYAPADSDEYRAQFVGIADVLVYDDEDENGRAHTCYRIISADAINRVVSVMEGAK